MSKKNELDNQKWKKQECVRNNEVQIDFSAVHSNKYSRKKTNFKETRNTQENRLQMDRIANDFKKNQKQSDPRSNKKSILVGNESVFLDDENSFCEQAFAQLSDKFIRESRNQAGDLGHCPESRFEMQIAMNEKTRNDRRRSEFIGKRARANVFDDFLNNQHRNLNLNSKSFNNQISAEFCPHSNSKWRQQKCSFQDQLKIDSIGSSNCISSFGLRKFQNLQMFRSNETPRFVFSNNKDGFPKQSWDPLQFSDNQVQLRSEESNPLSNYVTRFENKPLQILASFEQAELSQFPRLQRLRPEEFDEIRRSGLTKKESNSQRNQNLASKMDHLNKELDKQCTPTLEVEANSFIREFYSNSINPNLENAKFQKLIKKENKPEKLGLALKRNAGKREEGLVSRVRSSMDQESRLRCYQMAYKKFEIRYKFLERYKRKVKEEMKTIWGCMFNILESINKCNSLSDSSKKNILNRISGSTKNKFLEINLNLNLKDFMITETKLVRPMLEETGPVCIQKCLKRGRNSGWNYSEESTEFATESGRIPYVSGKKHQYILVKFKPDKKRKKFKADPQVIRNFSKLLTVLKKMFWNQTIEQFELDLLGNRDRKILSAILQKKKLIKKSSDVIFQEKEFNLKAQKPGHKRNEENLKFVFKYTQKFLRKQFKKNNSQFRYRKSDAGITQKNLVDLGFYTHYFGKIADDLDWPIAKFFHPKVLASAKSADRFLENPNLRPKTINKEYINNLKKSPDFIRDMSQYLHGEYRLEPNVKTGIVEEHKKCIEVKLVQKLHHWHKKIELYGQGEGMKKILKNLLTNQKCKMPWSITEIKRAVNETLHHFSMKLLEK